MSISFNSALPSEIKLFVNFLKFVFKVDISEGSVLFCFAFFFTPSLWDLEKILKHFVWWNQMLAVLLHLGNQVYFLIRSWLKIITDTDGDWNKKDFAKIQIWNCPVNISTYWLNLMNYHCWVPNSEQVRKLWKCRSVSLDSVTRALFATELQCLFFMLKYIFCYLKLQLSLVYVFAILIWLRLV